MKVFIRNNVKLVLLLMVIILLGVVGVAFAFSEKEIGVVMTTGEYNVNYKEIDRVVPEQLALVPDSQVLIEAANNNVLKIAFSVMGAKTNPENEKIIYDVSLSDLKIPDELRNSNFKWRLYKNDDLISEGTFEDGYDSENENRMVLTYTQQDLPVYSENRETADLYVFYAWLSISEACASDITNCTEEEVTYSSAFMGKTFSGDIRIELSTGTKITRVLGEAGKTITKLGLESSVKTNIPDFSKTNCNNGCDETTDGIYRTFDDLGISYYFRGSVTNNYVKFAGYYWRIVRINGDGSIRMVYDGTKAYENGTESEDRHIGKEEYNEYLTDISFGGYMNGTVDGVNFPNGTTNSKSKAEARANISDSTIKSYIDNWYKNNIEHTDYERYIADAIYCNERNMSTFKYSTESATGATITGTNEGFGDITSFFSMHDHQIVNDDNSKNEYIQRLYCQNVNDKFTKTTDLGNGKLKYSIGLLTNDEIINAGLSNMYGYKDLKYNNMFYLYTGFTYYTMSPLGYVSSDEINFKNGSGNRLNGIGITSVSNKGFRSSVYSANSGSGYTGEYVKPVISLESDAVKYGTGTVTNPFRITEAI